MSPTYSPPTSLMLLIVPVFCKIMPPSNMWILKLHIFLVIIHNDLTLSLTTPLKSFSPIYSTKRLTFCQRIPSHGPCHHLLPIYSPTKHQHNPDELPTLPPHATSNYYGRRYDSHHTSDLQTYSCIDVQCSRRFLFNIDYG